MNNDTSPDSRKTKPIDADEYRVAALDRAHRVSRFYRNLQEAAA